MVLELIASGLLALAVLWAVMQPLISGVSEHQAEIDEFDDVDPEETSKGRALLALKEIEFDRATGKLSDEDFESLNSKYERIALTAMSGCPRCAVVPRAGAQFCSECGANLVTDSSVA